MEQRNHSVATIAVLTVLCVFALFIGLRAAFKPFPDAPLSSDLSGTCNYVEFLKGDRIRPSDVLVSVFNASRENGLARNTLTQLAQRGFGSGTEGNIEARRVEYAEVWADTEDDPAARLVARQFGPRVPVVTGQDTSLGQGVVVVVGERFESLKRAPQSVKAPYNTQVCAPGA